MWYCLYTYAVLRIRAGVAVFHLAAQLIQHFVQCVGGQAADGIGHGFVGLLAQGGAGGSILFTAQLGIVSIDVRMPGGSRRQPRGGLGGG